MPMSASIEDYVIILEFPSPNFGTIRAMGDGDGALSPSLRPGLSNLAG